MAIALWVSVAIGLSYQDIKTDALGNRLWVRDDEQIDNVDRTRYHAIDAATGQQTGSALGTPTCGPPGTGTKSCHPNWYEYEFTQDHDLAGNVIATWGKETRGSDAFTANPIPTETRSFYEAADRLTYFNRHVNYTAAGEAGGVFEEYRYDALGRRLHAPSRNRCVDRAAVRAFSGNASVGPPGTSRTCRQTAWEDQESTRPGSTISRGR